MDANTQKLEQRVEALEDVCRKILQEIRLLRTEFREFREEQMRQWAEQSAQRPRRGTNIGRAQASIGVALGDNLN